MDGIVVIHRKGFSYGVFSASVLAIFIGVVITFYGVLPWLLTAVFCPILIFFTQKISFKTTDETNWFFTRDAFVLPIVLLALLGYFVGFYFADNGLVGKIGAFLASNIDLPISSASQINPKRLTPDVVKMCEMRCEEVIELYKRVEKSMFLPLIFSGSVVAFLPLLAGQITSNFRTLMHQKNFWLALLGFLIFTFCLILSGLVTDIFWKQGFLAKLSWGRGHTFLSTLCMWWFAWFGVVAWYGLFETIYTAENKDVMCP